MMQDATWCRRKDAFSFGGVVPVRGSVAATMAAFASSMLARVGEVGVAVLVRVSTAEAGEDGIEWRAEDASGLASGIADHRSAWRVMVLCDLVGVREDGAAFRIDGAPLLAWIERPDLTAPAEPAPSQLELTIMVDVDLFARQTYGTDRDNARLAAINAPRFNRFLIQLCADLGATITSVDAEDYDGEATVGGFTAGGG